MQPYTMTAKDHRANARRYLGDQIFDNKWLLALLVMLIYSLIISTASSLTGGIVSMIITGPMMAGLAKTFLSLSRKGEIRVETMFEGFEDDFLQTMLIGLMSGIFTLLWSLLFIIPGIIKSYAYSMAYFIKVDHPEYQWKACLDESQRIMKGHKWDLFCLDLSFIGWILLSYVTCLIGAFWVSPYIQAAHVSFYESIKDDVIFTDFNQNYNDTPNQFV